METVTLPDGTIIDPLEIHSVQKDKETDGFIIHFMKESKVTLKSGTCFDSGFEALKTELVKVNLPES